jgi:hypothetical protein
MSRLSQTVEEYLEALAVLFIAAGFAGDTILQGQAPQSLHEAIGENGYYWSWAIIVCCTAAGILTFVSTLQALRGELVIRVLIVAGALGYSLALTGSSSDPWVTWGLAAGITLLQMRRWVTLNYRLIPQRRIERAMRDR